MFEIALTFGSREKMGDCKILEVDLHGQKLKVIQDLSKVWKQHEMESTVVSLQTLFWSFQHKNLRILDASCNEVAKISGIAANKVC